MKKKIGGLPIVYDDGVLAGIVTERDVLRMLAAEHSPLFVEDAMISSLRVTAPDSPIGTVTKDMTKFRFRRLPVVSDDVLFGIITATDIMQYLGSREVFSRLITGNIEEVMNIPVRVLMAGNLFTTTPALNDIANTADNLAESRI